jgi:hypothetical protein
MIYLLFILIVLLCTISFLISQNDTLYYDEIPHPTTLSSPITSTTSTITTQPTPTIIPPSTSTSTVPLQSPSTTPIKQTVEQMIETFKTATGKQICVCENIFHTFLRDKRTPTPITDVDKKCFELAKQIKTTTTIPQQICTYRDNIFHPPCSGPKLNGSRCT